ncbi:hypothetical protein DUNSADRAFT_1467 [Dunaliella salina]|uniref:Encoded protein n=1 Tax=Dunaliella salina TaxID=3046 RepID=A0ABQ7GX22_DUNSA|nr:hypothetical protein DUNSADRAFT_1467 [Dunaliella salina]|eukprot:KAF5839154.1 hypothetical protein DUNSADRAFT_1467 [Dunaliella salina]
MPSFFGLASPIPLQKAVGPSRKRAQSGGMSRADLRPKLCGDTPNAEVLEAVRSTSKRVRSRGVSRADLRSSSAADYDGQRMDLWEDAQAGVMAVHKEGSCHPAQKEGSCAMALEGVQGNVHLQKATPELRERPDVPDVAYSTRLRGENPPGCRGGMGGAGQVPILMYLLAHTMQQAVLDF